ncbi:cryptochrome/photolyase family protein [Bacillus sp. DJP31]|uniref:cryptochrome/photolyase family protein n=1 Tax=Bacillus sp. DJP31 TaxID=3409789 RepID=UPI003BB63F49
MSTIGMWFRRDFRIQDNTALYEAVMHAKREGSKLLFFYHLDPKFIRKRSNHHLYFFQSLSVFKEELSKIGVTLHLLYGNEQTAFEKLLSDIELQQVYFNLDEVGSGLQRDLYVKSLLMEKKIQVHSFHDSHIHSTSQVVKNDGTHYHVFTPYYRAWLKKPKRKPKSIEAQLLKEVCICVDSLSNGEEILKNTISSSPIKWDKIGEKQARKQLSSFLEDSIYAYHEKRDIVFESGTSGLSKYLKTGNISARTVYDHVSQCYGLGSDVGVETYSKELAWRDFYHSVHYHFPLSKEEEINLKYKDLKWNEDESLFQSWCEGKTGFPLVDAAMKQLNETGWMHNRLRMITASFLTKDYLISWKKGEQYFEEMLIDYDESSNIGGWQWAASVGTDAVPYFRIFNPITQSKRFDSKGEFIKLYIPELRNVDIKHIHEPYKMNDLEQAISGCILGVDYPYPIVDHKIQRERAIELFKTHKSEG